jgi:hypothetical protein
MALQTTRIDDLTGEPDAAQVVITVNGEGIEIDLAGSSVAALTKALAPYWEAGTLSKYDVERKGFARKRIEPPKGTVDPKAVRAWAAANGIDAGARGRIPQAVVEQYLRS